MYWVQRFRSSRNFIKICSFVLQFSRRSRRKARKKYFAGIRATKLLSIGSTTEAQWLGNVKNTDCHIVRLPWLVFRHEQQGCHRNKNITDTRSPRLFLHRAQHDSELCSSTNLETCSGISYPLLSLLYYLLHLRNTTTASVHKHHAPSLEQVP